MNCSCYQEAYDVLVRGNDGILPDLYEVAGLTVADQPVAPALPLTVADVVALALVEMSTQPALGWRS